MKLLPSFLAAAVFLAAPIAPASAAVHVSVDFFHDSLESYGDWREVGDYGYCWQPRDVDRDWRPYSDGHWLYTDAGWTWDSEEPYSWAVYHYGRWARVDRIGWVWVPDTEWGPAWVSWRHSADHVGWAPLPPEARFTRKIGFTTRVDSDYDIGPANYSFVETRNFGAPRLRTVLIEPRQNITIIHQTTNITRISYVNNVVHNEGPQYDVISRQSAQPIRRLKLDRREENDFDPRQARAERLQAKVEGDSLRVMALPFAAGPAKAPKKFAAKVEKTEVDRGWKDAGTEEEVSKLRAKFQTEPAAPPTSRREKIIGAEEPANPIPAPVKRPSTGKVPRVKVPDTVPENPADVVKPSKPKDSVLKPFVRREEKADPAGETKPGKRKGVVEPRVPPNAKPDESIPQRNPKEADPVRKLPPPPKPAEPIIHDPKREAPNPSEPRPAAKNPEPRGKPEPAADPAPTRGKGKGKGNDKEKDRDGKKEEPKPQ